MQNNSFAVACRSAVGIACPEKRQVFVWYGVKEDATCEMDHFVSLEIGGADTLDNIWPQCGPPGSTGEAWDFRKKDAVEQFLGRQVRDGAMTQQAARQKITRDWPKAGPAQ